MYRKKFIAMFFVLGISMCGTTTASIVKYNFSQSGYDEGAIVTGMFEGEDVDGDGYLVSDISELSLSEVTAFNMKFSGNSMVPAFSLGLADLQILSYGLNGGPLGDSRRELISAAANSDLDAGFTIISDETGEDDNLITSVVFLQDSPISNSSELVIISAVPLPAAVWLFGSGLLGLIGINKSKLSANLV